MINKKRLAARIKRHEGFSNTAYLDQLRNKTIGYGHLIRPNENYKFKEKYSKKILNKLFHEDLLKATSDYNKIFFNHKLPPRVSEVLIEMIFQLGINKFLKFKKMIFAIKKKDFKRAATEMINSRWNKQTPKRVKLLVKKLLK